MDARKEMPPRTPETPNLLPKYDQSSGHAPPVPPAAAGTAQDPGFRGLNASSSPSSARAPQHRRSHSEMGFRISDDVELGSSDTLSSGFDEIGSEDDLFCAYMDIEKIGNKLDGGESGSGGGGGGTCRDLGSAVAAGEAGQGKTDNAIGAGFLSATENASAVPRPKHRYSNSVDGSIMAGSAFGNAEGVFGEIAEAKKAMPADKLAELAIVDPKRAKRILANRQSAARSKERKARYISELEQKVQTLQTEATSLSAQVALYQRDMMGLTSENAELKLRLQAMEQKAQLRDALNETLKQEVERLKIATGEAYSPSQNFHNFVLQHAPYNSLFYASPRQQSGDSQGLQMHHPFHQSQKFLANSHMPAKPNGFSDVMQQESLGRLQGLDIGRGSHVTSESPSISASGSSSTF